MLSINPKGILQLAKLQRAVLQARGVRYGIAEEKGIVELLKYVQENRDEAYDQLYQDFVQVLTPEEKLGLNLVKIAAAPTMTKIQSNSASLPLAESSVVRTVYYRGVKTQIIDDSGIY